MEELYWLILTKWHTKLWEIKLQEQNFQLRILALNECIFYSIHLKCVCVCVCVCVYIYIYIYRERERERERERDSLATIFVRTYVFHMLVKYVAILCNWLILWQNAPYLYLGRSRMYLILQETRFQIQVLNPCKSIQESSVKVLLIKAR